MGLTFQVMKMLTFKDYVLIIRILETIDQLTSYVDGTNKSFKTVILISQKPEKKNWSQSQSILNVRE